MKLTFIGTGGAFAPISVGNTNIMLEENGKIMMIDFGTTAPYIFRDEMKRDFGDIDAVYVTHAHADHIGGLEFLAFHRYFIPNKDGNKIRPKLFVHSELIQPLWCQSLKGGLDGLHGRTAGLTDYFECFPVKKSKSFMWEGSKFTPFETLHVNCGFMSKSSFGVMIQTPSGKKTLFTGDSVFNPNGLSYLYEEADLIFQDGETSEVKSHVHSNIYDLNTLNSKIKEKMWICHHSKRMDGFGFAGFVEKFQEFDI